MRYLGEELVASWRASSTPLGHTRSKFDAGVIIACGASNYWFAEDQVRRRVERRIMWIRFAVMEEVNLWRYAEDHAL